MEQNLRCWKFQVTHTEVLLWPQILALWLLPRGSFFDSLPEGQQGVSGSKVSIHGGLQIVFIRKVKPLPAPPCKQEGILHFSPSSAWGFPQGKKSRVNRSGRTHGSASCKRCFGAAISVGSWLLQSRVCRSPAVAMLLAVLFIKAAPLLQQSVRVSGSVRRRTGSVLAVAL